MRQNNSMGWKCFYAHGADWCKLHKCSTALCFLLCFIFGGFKPARLCRSAEHGIYCQANNTLYNPWSTGEYMPECCWMFKMFTLKMRSAVNVWHYSRCFAWMLVMGFPLGRIEKLPKNSEWQWPGREHCCPGAALPSSWASKMLSLGYARWYILALEKFEGLLCNFGFLYLFIWLVVCVCFFFSCKEYHHFKKPNGSIYFTRMNFHLSLGKRTHLRPVTDVCLSEELKAAGRVPWAASSFRRGLMLFPCCKNLEKFAGHSKVPDQFSVSEFTSLSKDFQALCQHFLLPFLKTSKFVTWFLYSHFSTSSYLILTSCLLPGSIYRISVF